jgi:hypothetical protein
MTPSASLLQPDANPALYTSSVLMHYLDLPDTPSRTNAQDQRQARAWFDRSVPLSVVETALLLASLRRQRPPGVPSLPPIRSLAYFQPIVDELLENPVPEGYLHYLRLKLRSIVDSGSPNDVQKTTLSGDR